MFMPFDIQALYMVSLTAKNQTKQREKHILKKKPHQKIQGKKQNSTA